jgi:type II secretory pathway pseudopilin PulG
MLGLRDKSLIQKGDTIIEVLIIMAIAGSALGAAYRITSQSSQKTRQAQERSEALQLAEEQLERLRLVAKDNVDVGCSTTAVASDTCFKFSSDDAVPVAYGSGSIYSFCIGEFDSTLNKYPIFGLDPSKISDEANMECRIDKPDKLYKVGIYYNTGESLTNFYIFAGRYAANQGTTANTAGFDIAPIMYRINP